MILSNRFIAVNVYLLQIVYSGESSSKGHSVPASYGEEKL